MSAAAPGRPRRASTRPRRRSRSALEQIAARAGELDAEPRFPGEDFASLLRGRRAPAGRRSLALRPRRRGRARSARVAAADASTARILDGHFNGVERLALLADDDELRARELARRRRRRAAARRVGRRPGARRGRAGAHRARASGGELALRGVKTFCSGAGGVQRALVIARDERDERRIAYVDVTRGVDARSRLVSRLRPARLGEPPRAVRRRARARAARRRRRDHARAVVRARRRAHRRRRGPASPT